MNLTKEEQLIQSYPRAVTKTILAEHFRSIGITPGMTLLVHSSLSSLGWVCGGGVAVVQALMEVITEKGTLVMPTHSADLSDPANWMNPPVPKHWWETIRETMPAFDPAYTPTRGMGHIPETFRTFPQVMRSSHPAMSFAAWGNNAKFITEGHSLNFGLGDQSPLARIYDLDGSVLLIGVDFESNTSFHLAENRLPEPTVVRAAAPIMENGERKWAEYSEVDFQTDLFGEMGARFEETGAVTVKKVAASACRLFKQRACVDFAVDWFLNREGD